VVPENQCILAFLAVQTSEVSKLGEFAPTGIRVHAIVEDVGATTAFLATDYAKLMTGETVYTSVNITSSV
jgi:enoyl-[acyl-carrier-protein] reductase (NADH)